MIVASFTAPWYMIVFQGLILLGLLSWLIDVVGSFLGMLFRAPVRIVQAIIYVDWHSASDDPTAPNWRDERAGYVEAKMQHFNNKVIEGKAKRSK